MSEGSNNVVDGELHPYANRFSESIRCAVGFPSNGFDALTPTAEATHDKRRE